MANNDSTNDTTSCPNEAEKIAAEYAQFAYIVSHDLAAPFNQIEGFSNIILKKYADALDEKGLSYFDFIIRSAQKGRVTIDGLLEFSRINTITEPFAPCVLDQLVKSALAELQEADQLPTSAIEVPTTLPTIDGDEKQLTRLFYHLIKNALLFHEKDSTPHASLTHDDKGDHYLFAIKDQGIGIEEKNQQAVFEPLKRCVRESDFAGVGMGLAIAQKIVERHGGRIWCEANTQSPSGAVFYFTLSKKT